MTNATEAYGDAFRSLADQAAGAKNAARRWGLERVHFGLVRDFCGMLHRAGYVERCVGGAHHRLLTTCFCVCLRRCVSHLGCMLLTRQRFHAIPLTRCLRV